MHWMLPLSFIITPANATFVASQIFNKTYLHCQSLAMVMLTALINKLKLQRNLEKN